jgi:hypothetical protein
MKTLLVVTALLEAAAGFALATSPSLFISLLLGSPLDMRSGWVVGRLAGVALLTLGLVCWLARNDHQSSVTAGPVAALLFYNAASLHFSYMPAWAWDSPASACGRQSLSTRHWHCGASRVSALAR